MSSAAQAIDVDDEEEEVAPVVPVKRRRISEAEALQNYSADQNLRPTKKDPTLM